MEQRITLRTKEGERKLIQNAAAYFGVGFSTFTRIAALEKARQIISQSPITDGEQGNSPSLCSTPINHTQGVSFPEGAASPSAHSQLNPKVPAQ